MPNSTSEEKLRWIGPILSRDISIKNMAKVCPFSERTIKYWLSQYREYGPEGLANRSTRPRTSPKDTSIREKERIIELRHETHLGALKLHYKLAKEGITVHERTIGKILKSEGLVRVYRSRKAKPYKRPASKLAPGELVEVDIKYVPGRVAGNRYYQYTAIDCASRWRYLAIYESPSSTDAIRFLVELVKIAPFRIRAVKTDNGACFTNRYAGYITSTSIKKPNIHYFDKKCKELTINHYLIDPGKPAQNGKVERSHRTDQEHFYDLNKFLSVEDLKEKLSTWNKYYNELEHIALGGLTPNEMLIKLTNKKVQNVRT